MNTKAFHDAGASLSTLQALPFPPDSFELRQGNTGLWFVTSSVPELRGLLIAKPTAEEAIAAAPGAIIELLYVQVQDRTTAPSMKTALEQARDYFAMELDDDDQNEEAGRLHRIISQALTAAPRGPGGAHDAS